MRVERMEFIFLADKVDAKWQLAKWYFEQWGDIIEEGSLELFNQKLDDYLNRDCIPLVILAVDAGNVIGAAQLKYHEMSIFPKRAHWLGGVYVIPPARGKHVASALVNQAESIAHGLGVSQLYLQTEALDGGLYAGLGWQGIEKVNYRGVDVLVMSKALNQ